MNSKAFTKIQAVVVVTIIVVAVVGGSVAFFLWSEPQPSAETIRIGILADLDKPTGIHHMQAAILAAEEINAEGGILGKQIEIIGEDSDVNSEGGANLAVTALTRLITLKDVDFVIVGGGEDYVMETGVEYKKILLGTTSPSEALTQKVIDDYDKYKYFFRLRANETAFGASCVDTILHLRELTGFTKVAYLGPDVLQIRIIMDALDSLSEISDIEVVYGGKHPADTMDFGSYFAAAEAAGAEIMVPLEIGEAGMSLALEWYNRQSPMVLWGLISGLTGPETWEWSRGRVNYMSLMVTSPIKLEYELTSKTLGTQEAYQNRWGELPPTGAMVVYDCIRFLLFDALERAQTTETQAVIQALEESEIENSLEENFKFTSSHDHLHMPGESGMMFQWQTGGKMAIVYPKKAMEETGATYIYPDWDGPWNK